MVPNRFWILTRMLGTGLMFCFLNLRMDITWTLERSRVPNPFSGGIKTFLDSPGFIPGRISSIPGITWPFPKTTTVGSSVSSTILSEFSILPFQDILQIFPTINCSWTSSVASCCSAKSSTYACSIVCMFRFFLIQLPPIFPPFVLWRIPCRMRISSFSSAIWAIIIWEGISTTYRTFSK